MVFDKIEHGRLIYETRFGEQYGMITETNTNLVVFELKHNDLQGSKEESTSLTAAEEKREKAEEDKIEKRILASLKEEQEAEEDEDENEEEDENADKGGGEAEPKVKIEAKDDEGDVNMTVKEEPFGEKKTVKSENPTEQKSKPVKKRQLLGIVNADIQGPNGRYFASSGAGKKYLDELKDYNNYKTAYPNNTTRKRPKIPDEFLPYEERLSTIKAKEKEARAKARALEPPKRTIPKKAAAVKLQSKSDTGKKSSSTSSGSASASSSTSKVAAKKPVILQSKSSIKINTSQPPPLEQVKVPVIKPSTPVPTTAPTPSSAAKKPVKLQSKSSINPKSSASASTLASASAPTSSPSTTNSNTSPTPGTPSTSSPEELRQNKLREIEQLQQQLEKMKKEFGI